MMDREFVDSAERLIAEEAENRKQMEKSLALIGTASKVIATILFLLIFLVVLAGNGGEIILVGAPIAFVGVFFILINMAVEGLSPYLSTQSKIASAMLSLAIRRETDKAES